MIFIDFNLYYILSLFYSYFYLYLYLFIYLFFGHEETDLFGRKINRILKRGDFIFRGTAHILLPCGDRRQEGKKRKKGKEGEKEFGRGLEEERRGKSRKKRRLQPSLCQVRFLFF